MNPLSLIPLPWLLLGLVALCGGSWWHGYASNDQADVVQAEWDRSVAIAQRARQVRIDKVHAETTRLQVAADLERKRNDEAYKTLDRRLAAALGRLQDRPARPGPPADGVPTAASPAAEGGAGTGAGLYRDDAVLLVRLADLSQRIRTQRDTCYRQYDEAREALKAYAAPPPPKDD